MKNHTHDFKVLPENTLARNWRPAMAWQYFAVCIFDFIVAPTLHTAAQFYSHQVITQWNPITLQGGALYHLAMAAIIGVYSYGRTLEKLNLANRGVISGGPAPVITNSGITIPPPLLPAQALPIPQIIVPSTVHQHPAVVTPVTVAQPAPVVKT